MSELSDVRAATVAAEITKAFDAVKQSNVTREGTLLGLARAAAMGQWSEVELAHGIRIVKRLRKGKESSLETLSSEIKRACHPNVRSHVKILAEIAHEIWDAEADNENQPCRDAFQRCYHMLVNYLLREALYNNKIITDRNEIIKYASTHSRRSTSRKAYERFDRLRQQLNDFYEEYPVEDLILGLNFINEISMADVITCRKSTK